MKAKTISLAILIMFSVVWLIVSTATGQTIYPEAEDGPYASNPDPADGAVIPGWPIGNDIYTLLDFTPGETADEFTGYFHYDYDKVASRAQDANLGPPPYGGYRYYVGLYAIPPWTESLVRGMTYYWCVDETDAMDNTYPGDIWEFTIQDYKACCPDPPDGATVLGPDVLLRWGPGIEAVEHDVYFGTDFNDVNNAPPGPWPFVSDPPPEYLCTVEEPNMLVTGLSENTTYYWRIDEVSGRLPPPLDPGTIYKGDVWCFKTAGLTAHWKFDEGTGSVAYDSAGSNDGTIYGAAWASGIIDGALDFDGEDDYVEFASVAALEGDNLTALAWVRVDESAGGLIPVIMQHDLIYSNNGYCFYIVDSKPAFYLRADPSNIQAISPEKINAEQWYHIAGSNDSSNLKVYVDGQLKDSKESSGLTGVNYNAYIGLEPISMLFYYKGLIDDVRIYNRALSAEEIEELYNSVTEPPVQGYKASSPNPPDEATVLGPDVLLSWVPGFEAVEHDVYFGTDFNDVNNAPPGPWPYVSDPPSEYLGTVEEPNMLVTGLSENTTYYWRVDEVSGRLPPPLDPGTIYKGDVWSFITLNEPNITSLEHWTEPVTVTEVNTEYGEHSPFLSSDGLSLYFARGNTSGYYYFRIFEATREVPYGPFTSVNQVLSSSNQHVFNPWVSPDNLRMYYFAQKESPVLWQLKVSERASVIDPWPAGSDISEINQLGKPHAPKLTADELIIVFISYDIPGGLGGYDLWMATRPDMNSPFDAVTNLAELNTADNEGDPYITPDGLTLLFHSNRNGSYQIFRATRQSLIEPFGNVEHLSFFDTPEGLSVSPSLSNDGSTLYFVRQIGDDRSTRDIYVSYLIDPNKASAPSPAHGATYVDPNVVFSWAPGQDALSHNVFLGTSFDDVNDADTLSDEYKGNFDVNSYDPCGLDSGTTYYWRIDEVVEPNAEPNMYKGDVWSFTTRVELSSHLVAWWMFDEGQGSIAYDSSNDNDGTIYGAAWTTGQINGALNFDGLNDYVDMADTVKHYLETSYTISLWIKADTLFLNKAISAYRHSTNGSPVLFQIVHYNEDVGFDVRDNSHNLAHALYLNAIQTNTWYHVAGVREANTVNVYVNGVGGIPDSATLGEISPDNLKIGAFQFGGNPVSNHFDGTIDDVMIFNRALSEEEIWELYQSAFCEPGYPCISLSPETFEFYAEEGGSNPAPQTLSICNYGDGILNYQVTTDCSWLKVDPNAGSSEGETTEVTVSVDISGLDCGIYDCNLIVSDPNASNSPRIVPVNLEVYHEYCNIDVRVVPVAVLTDPHSTSEVRTALPDSISGVVRGNTYYVEIWASDIRKINTGLTGVYVDVDFCSQTNALAVEHGKTFVTFPDGTIQPGGVDEFGGSALPSGGGIEPEWVRVGWIHMSTQTETGTCTISLLPSSTGIGALDRGLIQWTFVELGSIELEITPPVRSYDLDGDDFIGVGDLSLFAGSWKQSVPPANEEHDFDCDNKVGVGDLSWFATGWQKYTDDPTILYPPCSIGDEAAWLLNNSAHGMLNSNNVEALVSTNIPEPPADIAFAMAILDSPSPLDTATVLPTSVKRLSAGQTYYLELWVSDVGYVNTGLVSAYIDLNFPSDAVTIIDVSYNGIFTLFNEETVLSGVIDELGGSSLEEDVGVEPEWARVAVVEILANATLPFVTFTLSPSSTEVSALGRGIISWDDISLPGLLICPANFNGDAGVDMKDLAILASAWGTEPGNPKWDLGCDISIPPDNSINGKDLAWLVDSWLEGIVP